MLSYAVALIPPHVSCTTCEISNLTDELYSLFAPYMQKENEHTVAVGGEFFGHVKGFKLSSEGYTDQDIVNMNTISVEEHLMFGYKPDFLIVEGVLYRTKMITKEVYKQTLAQYLHHTAVGYEIGGEFN